VFCIPPQRASDKALALTGMLPEIECGHHHFLKCSALNPAPNIVLDLPAALEDPAIWKSAGLSGGTCDNVAATFCIYLQEMCLFSERGDLILARHGTVLASKAKRDAQRIVQGFNSGRRSSYLKGVLLALVLNAPISLNAQSGSLPQSQPAQSASAPPPATQSQSQSTPACSNAPPILKRGKQPDLPPCPDPPLAPSAPADSIRTRSLSPSEALIERAREAAFEFSEKLPNFICQEVMARYRQRGREETPLDVVSAEIIYDHANESYSNVKINDRPTDTSLEEISGSWSTGEFASTLLELFRPDTNARFRSGGASSISGLRGQVYDFEVRSENSHWRVQADSLTMVAGYGGSVWVDPSTARVLRIEMQARNIPPDFPMDTIESAVDYSYLSIGGTSVLLPVHAESLGCHRSASHCSHNIIDFRNYHEFRVDVKIGNGQGP
jgi:hypothetical protein